MDYRQFRLAKGIDRKEMIATIRDVCPKYSKIQQSMIEAPDKYGLCLLPSLDTMLEERYGEGATATKAHKKAQPNRTKKNRFQVWLDDDTAAKLIAIRAKDGTTTQQLLQDLIENLIARYEIKT